MEQQGGSRPSSGLLTVKGLQKPGPGLADREARTLKTAMKDTACRCCPELLPRRLFFNLALG